MSSSAAALDLGGSHVSAARVDLSGAATEPDTVVRIPFRPDAVRSELLGAIVAAALSVATGVDVLGVAAPGPFDYGRGICRVQGLAKLEALHGVDLRHELTAALGTATSISFLNDAEAFLLRELWAGAARGHARAVGITLGTGLGSAFAAGERIVSDGASLPPDGSLHLVPFRGSPVEDVISARGLLGTHPAHFDGVAQLAAAARDGDDAALRLFAFGASCLVVGGSIAHAWELFGPRLQCTLAVLPGVELICPAANIDTAPLLGAARYAATQRG